MKKVRFCDLSPLYQKLVIDACNVRENAYAPYSHYKVGAALLSEKGNIYSGCNVETVTYSQTTHAERVAINNMVTHGERKIVALCCVSGEKASPPCAECRQVIWEFCCDNSHTEIIGVNSDKSQIEIYEIGEIYPLPFGPEELIF